MNSNIVELNPRTAFEDVLFYFEGLESEATLIRYKKAIERFIDKQHGIPLQHVQEDHFNKLTYTDMKKYRDYLRRKGYAPSTVNNEMVAIFNLMKELNKIQREDGSHPYSLNVDQLRTKSLRIKEVNSSGDITWDEVDSWIDWIKGSDMANKERKWIFFHIARLTGLRKEALSELTYGDLRKSADTWILHSVIKGSTTKVSIKDEDAELLFSLREGKGRDEKILKMSTKTMERLMAQIREEFSIPEERRVTLHSLRGLSIYESYLASGMDVLKAQKHAGHSSLETTYGYVKDRNDTSESVTLYMGEEFDEDCVKDVTQEQWIEIYKELSRSSKYEIQRVMDKLGYSQK